MNQLRCKMIYSEHPSHSWGRPNDMFHCDGKALDVISVPVPPGGGFSIPPSTMRESAGFSDPSDYPEGERVVHPKHYNSRVPGIECIEVVQHFNFNLGNVIKYVWRAGDKGNFVEDLKKARQYLDFEIARIEGSSES